MRFVRASLMSFLIVPLLLGSALAETRRDAFTSGKDWSDEMTDTQKIMSLIPPSLLFHRYHVPLRRALPDYIPMIDRVLSTNPELAGEEVTSIFASTVYVYEPESREALRAMELELLKGGYDAAPLGPPRLHIKPDGREVLALD